MTTKKQLKKEIDDLKEQVERLNKAKEVSDFLYNNPKGFRISQPFNRDLLTFGTLWTQEFVISLDYVYCGKMMHTGLGYANAIKDASVVRETTETYTVRVDREWTDNGKTENRSAYYRVYKRTGAVEDMEGDKDLWSEEEKQ